MRTLVALFATVMLSTSCGGAQSDEPEIGTTSSTAVRSVATSPTTTQSPVTTTVASTDELYPDVVGVSVTNSGDGTFSFDVTISSPYDTADRYADAWRIVGADGTVFGVRELLHGHPNEQPFTRSLAGVAIPSEVATVVVEGRDQLNGWGGTTFEVSVPQD